MVKELVHDAFRLGLKSSPAKAEDISTGQDLLDTLKANSKTCVGMAANMIGVQKRIIAFDNNGMYMVMYNPVIMKKSEPFAAEESCVSLLGGPRPCVRFKKIRVQWQTEEFRLRQADFSGWTAQIIQHEIDHCNGVLI